MPLSSLIITSIAKSWTKLWVSMSYQTSSKLGLKIIKDRDEYRILRPNKLSKDHILTETVSSDGANPIKYSLYSLWLLIVNLWKLLGIFALWFLKFTKETEYLLVGVFLSKCWTFKRTQWNPIRTVSPNLANQSFDLRI